MTCKTYLLHAIRSNSSLFSNQNKYTHDLQQTAFFYYRFSHPHVFSSNVSTRQQGCFYNCSYFDIKNHLCHRMVNTNILHLFNNGNPFTHYSHINIVNLLTNSYPYDVPLGIAVSYHTQNANATFLLTDGYAAWGIAGIVIIGFIFYFFLELSNSISYNYQLEDLLVLFLPTVSYLLNVSFLQHFFPTDCFS